MGELFRPRPLVSILDRLLCTTCHRYERPAAINTTKPQISPCTIIDQGATHLKPKTLYPSPLFYLIDGKTLHIRKQGIHDHVLANRGLLA